MRKKLIKNTRNGSISLFVLLSILFFLTIVSAVSISNKNRESDSDTRMHKIKSTYEKDVGSENLIYEQKIAKNSSITEYKNDKLVFDKNQKKIERTGMYLFNNENINKDFEIVFTFGNENKLGQNFQATILNSSDEVNETYNGFYLRVSSEENGSLNLVLKGQNETNAPYPGKVVQIKNIEGKKLRILRRDSVIYYSYNNENEVKLIDNLTNTYETEVTLGGIIDKDNNWNRFYDGEICEVLIKVFEKSKNKATLLAYEKSKLITEKPINSKYINTGVMLFNDENKEKDFEISLNIDQFGKNVNNATLFNSFVELDGQYRGVLFRIQNSKLQLEANAGSGKKRKEWGLSDISQITIKRLNKKLYYSTNISTTDTFLIDLSSIKSHNIPATFACSMDSTKSPPAIFRNFIGTLSNMKIKLDGNDLFYQDTKKFTGINETEYINTNIKLFDNQNWGKDFEISFNIDEIRENTNNATLISSFLESSTNSGFLLKIQNNKLRLEGYNGQETYKDFALLDVNKITLKRTNNILKYIINEEKIENSFMNCSLVEKHSIPVCIGCYLDADGTTAKGYFNGVLSNIKIYLEQ